MRRPDPAAIRTRRARRILLAGLALGACARAYANQDDWALHGFDSAETRHSPLTNITPENVSEVGLAFEFRDFTVRGRTHHANEATPLAIDGVLYFTGPWSVVYAVDGATGTLLWRYDPGVPGQWARNACCDVVNRGVAIRDDVLYVGTLDGYLDAVDIDSGKRRWRSDTLVDRSRPYTITGAPRLAGDLVLIGNGGADLGVRGYVSAYREDGSLAWRFYTVPGPGEDEHPEIAVARKTWPKDAAWAFGLGGTAWDSMTYDPDSGIVYVGTGNGSPWPAAVRSPGGGDNLFLSSILAIESVTGKLLWHYQTTPGDSWDYTATQHMILAEAEFGGDKRKVLLQAPKNGFFYVLDRQTGELLSGKPYTDVTWATHIDLDTGRPYINASSDYSNRRQVVRPSIFGGHNWQPMSFDPALGLVFIPVLDAHMGIRVQGRDYLPGSINVAAAVDEAPRLPDADPLLDGPAARPKSRLVAWDPVSATETWSSLPGTWWSGGILSTASGLVIQGGSDGQLRFYESSTGRLLHAIETGTAVLAPPMSYQIGGRQFIAILAGFGGAPKAYPAGSAPLDYENFERLLVFALGGKAVPLPPEHKPPPLAPLHPQREFDRALVAEGKQQFIEHCARCHNERGAPGPYPNLWNLPPGLYDAFGPIVIDGALAEAGMPGFGDVLDEDGVRAIREYLLFDELTYGRRH